MHQELEAGGHPSWSSACRALTSLVLVRRNLAWVRLASPSMFMVPMKLVLIVLMGLYLQNTALHTQPLPRLVGRVSRTSVVLVCLCI